MERCIIEKHSQIDGAWISKPLLPNRRLQVCSVFDDSQEAADAESEGQLLKRLSPTELLKVSLWLHWNKRVVDVLNGEVYKMSASVLEACNNESIAVGLADRGAADLSDCEMLRWVNHVCVDVTGKAFAVVKFNIQNESPELLCMYVPACKFLDLHESLLRGQDMLRETQAVQVVGDRPGKELDGPLMMGGRRFDSANSYQKKASW